MTTSVFRAVFESYENKGFGFVLSWSPWQCHSLRTSPAPFAPGGICFSFEIWRLCSTLSGRLPPPSGSSDSQWEPAHICETRCVFSKTTGSVGWIRPFTTCLLLLRYGVLTGERFLCTGTHSVYVPAHCPSPPPLSLAIVRCLSLDWSTDIARTMSYSFKGEMSPVLP